MNVVLECICVFFLVLYDILKAAVLSMIPGSSRWKNVEGQTVLITGAGSGLGRGLAVEFAKLNANLVLWDINKDGNEETAELVKQYPINVHTYTCDLSQREEVYRVAEKVKEEVGFIDILVNNAGIVTGRKFLDSPDSLIEKTMDVNINAHFWTCKQFVPSMIQEKRGHVVTIASAAGLSGVVGLADYCASKYAAVGFNAALQCEFSALGLDDVRTTVVCPVYIRTGMFTGVKARFPLITPLLEPEYVVNQILSAVLTNRRIVVLPKVLSFYTGLKHILPAKAGERLDTLLGVDNSMDDFIGRNKSQ